MTILSMMKMVMKIGPNNNCDVYYDEPYNDRD